MIFQLDSTFIGFPDPALAEEDGLLAVGGDLSSERLLKAYSQGIFPWYSDDTPILWYAPHERFVLYPEDIKVSKSMQKILDRGEFEFTFNHAFGQVIAQCANIERRDQDGTWIVDDMQKAYMKLHKEGFAHSIEVWRNKELVGGLYGVLCGGVFCGESMFSRVANASKAGLIFLSSAFDLRIIDCQIYSEHLSSMGAKLIEASNFYSILTNEKFEHNGLQKLFRNT